jgi:two-component system response regulator (stage 0 sporulation protein F)
MAKKILIVDDEKFVTDALEGFFHSRGYHIFKTEDGEAALKIIENEILDLVLLDIKLPKVDGIRLLTYLRRDYPRTKVIVMTAYDLEYKQRVDSVGCDAFFLKPLLIEDLTRAVEQLLSEEMPALPEQLPAAIRQEPLDKTRILVISPRFLISRLVKDYFSNPEACKGNYEVLETGMAQLEQLNKFQPDIILMDVALVGLLGEFGTTLMKLPQPPKEIILFGDPAIKWEEVEVLIRRGIKFIEMPPDLRDERYLIKETIQRLHNAIKEACVKYGLKGGLDG